jgi:DNA-3-methyladenine glycosylase
MGALCGREYFERPVLEVARDLLGCRLCRRVDGRTLCWQVTETEAYDGPEDKACHAHKGRTGRTEVMFGAAGVWYVYLCYGVHWMLNIVTGPEEYPAAVLIRGAGELNGPGRLTRALAITGELNRKPAGRESGLWLEEGRPVAPQAILTAPRVGVDYAGPDWSSRHYRFIAPPCPS